MGIYIWFYLVRAKAVRCTSNSLTFFKPFFSKKNSFEKQIGIKCHLRYNYGCRIVLTLVGVYVLMCMRVYVSNNFELHIKAIFKIL